MSVKKLLLKIPLCTALIESLNNYNKKSFFADVKAAFVVSLVALPLSMALAIAIGLPPQHGLYTAIIAGFFTPLLGGSKFQVSGPTAAFVVILAPIVTEFGLRGIIWCQILAGIFLIILGIGKIGRFINYVPHSVTTGFTTGIAIVILVLSLKDLFGLDITALPNAFIDKLKILADNFYTFKPYEVFVSALTLVIILYQGKITKFIPSPIIAIGFAAVIAYLFKLYGITDITTIADRFSYTDILGNKTPGIPPYFPQLHIPGFSSSELFAIPTLTEFSTFMIPSMIIAALAALESLLSAKVADNIVGTKHEPNAELNAIGISNILCGLFSGIPATGAIARTATLITAEAKSPISSSMHALFILLFMVSLSHLAGHIPMCALAALLFVVACKMSHFHHVMHILKYKPTGDKITMLGCLLATAFVDMVVGVTVGLTLALIFYKFGVRSKT